MAFWRYQSPCRQIRGYLHPKFWIGHWISPAIKRATIINIKRHHFSVTPLPSQCLDSFAQALEQTKELFNLYLTMWECLWEASRAFLTYSRDDFFYTIRVCLRRRAYKPQILHWLRLSLWLRIFASISILKSTPLPLNARPSNVTKVFAKSISSVGQLGWPSLRKIFPNFYNYIEKSVIQYSKPNKLHTGLKLFDFNLHHLLYLVWINSSAHEMPEEDSRGDFQCNINSSHSLMIQRPLGNFLLPATSSMPRRSLSECPGSDSFWIWRHSQQCAYFT